MAPLFLAGPTGAGKSSVALALALRCGGEIVNADAFQLYRGIEIITAAPTDEDRALVPHHLYGALDLGDTCHAARYAALARPVIDEIAARGALPIVVGGTGLYLKALTHGLSDLPEADPALRASLERLSLEELVTWFTRLDPDGAAATNLANRRYVQRGVEISLQSGHPMSGLRNDWKDAPGAAAPDFNGILLSRDREDLYDRINRRVPAMLDQGALEEVRAAAPRLSATAAKAIGIRDLQEHLAGAISRDEGIDRIRQATRRFAKRQGTWFRREPGFRPLPVAPGTSPDTIADQILALFPQIVDSQR